MKVLFASTLLLALFASVFSEDLCPPANYIQPCECLSQYKPVTYKCSPVLDQDTMVEVFKKSYDYPLNALIFDHCSLLYINKTLIDTKEISIVAIYHSRFTSLFTSPPAEGNKIQTIILRNSSFNRGVDFKLFKNLQMNILQIKEVQLKRIGNTFVENVQPTLKQLTMEKAKIQSVHNEAFAKLTALTTLSCAYNSIKAIKRSMFPRETQLYMIDFSHNKIENLADDIFSNMPHLRDLYFNENKLKAFTSAAFEGVFGQLHAVHLDDNPILCDCKVKWYTTKSRSVKVTGKCGEPGKFKGWNLNQLSEGDFHYCGQ